MRLFGRKKQVEVVEVEKEIPRLPDGPPVDDQGRRSLVDHRDYILSLIEPLNPFGMQLLDAQDLAICEEITAPTDLPRLTTAATSGYAIFADDVEGADHDQPVRLDVTTNTDLAENQAVIVEEGDALPAGSDAVLPWSATNRDQTDVLVFEPVRSGDNLNPAGTDVTDGQVLVGNGQILGPREVGLLAGLGIDKVLARPRPRVVVLGSGAGLVEPGRRLGGPHETHDANGFMIAAAAKAAGAHVWRVGVVSNDPEDVAETISDQLIRADLVISTGGVKDRPDELIRQVMPTLGRTDFAEVALESGQSHGFGLIGDEDTPMIMLPASPVNAYLAFHAFVRPVIRKLMGTEPVTPPAIRGYARTMLRSDAGLTQLVLANVSNLHSRNEVEIIGDQTSHGLSDLTKANAVVVLDEETEVVKAGEPLTCWMLDY